jgi:plasmid stability protein
MSTTITVRNLDEETQRILKHRAVDNKRSFEAEIRATLHAAAHAPTPTNADILFAAAAQFREAARGTGFAVPERTDEQPREVFA